MAESNPTFVSQLVEQMKSLTPEADKDALLDLTLEHVVDAGAEKLALTQGNNCSVPI